MKSSLRSDEVQGLPWMKSNPSNLNPAKQDFIAKAISSTIGEFHPSKTDLTARYIYEYRAIRLKPSSFTVGKHHYLYASSFKIPTYGKFLYFSLKSSP